MFQEKFYQVKSNDRPKTEILTLQKNNEFHTISCGKLQLKQFTEQI